MRVPFLRAWGEGMLTQSNVLKNFHTIGIQFHTIPAVEMVLAPSQTFCMSYNGQFFRCDWKSWQWLMTQLQLTSKHRERSGGKSRKMLGEMDKWRGSLVPLPAHLLLCWCVDAALLGVEIPPKAIIRLLTSLWEVSPIVQMFAVLMGLVSGRAGSRAKAFWWSEGTEERTGSDKQGN